MKSFIITLVLMMAATGLRAESWQQLEGRYCTVEYQPALRQTADSLLKISESWIPRLCQLTEWPLSSFTEKKARIILTDAPDIPNGYALANDIVIYGLSSWFVPIWSGRDSWYETVLKHELVHHIIYRITERKLGFMGALTNLAVPRWFHEGLAQYFAESWNLYRGDITLQGALLDGKLSYNALNSLEDGRLLYAAGHAFVRFLADQYGDSSLVKLLHFAPRDWSYEFNRAFRHIYSKTPEEVFRDFYRYLVLYYGDKLSDYPTLPVTKQLPMPGYRLFRLFPLAGQDSTYLAAAQLRPTDQFSTAFTFRVKDGEFNFLSHISDHFDTPLVYDREHQRIAWGRFNLGTTADQTSIRFRWYIYDLTTKRQVEVPTTLRARYAAFDSDGSLILCEVVHDGSRFWRFDPRQNSMTKFYETNMPVGRLQAWQNGIVVFSAMDSTRNRRLFVLQNNRLTKLNQDTLIASAPVIIDDSLLVFNRVRRNRPTLALLNKNRQRVKTLVDADIALEPLYFDPASRQLFVSLQDHYQAGHLSAIPLDSLMKAKSVVGKVKTDYRYARWTMISPAIEKGRDTLSTQPVQPKPRPVAFPQGKLTHGFTFGFPWYDSGLGVGLFVSSTWVESLQRQGISATAVLYQKDWYESFLAFTHFIKYRNLLFSTVYYHGPAIFSIADGRRLRTYQDIPVLSISRPLYLHGNRRLLLEPDISYGYYHYRLKEQQADFPSSYSFHGASLGARFFYALPTRLYPVIPAKVFSARIRYFNSFEPLYDFNILQTDLNLGSKLFFDQIGVMIRGSYLSSYGNLPPLNRVGIDRFYELDVPRDVTYTRTVRGVRRDIQSNSLLWASGEMNLLLSGNTGLKLLFIPIDKLVLSGFYDYAAFAGQDVPEISGYGAELNGIWEYLKFGGGYAVGRLPDGTESREWYWRVGIMLPELYHRP